MQERKQENAQRVDRGYLWLGVFSGLALAVAADPPLDFLSSAASVVAGTLIGLIVSRYYSRQASEELRAEAEKLRQLQRLMLRAMEEAGLVEFTREGGLVRKGRVGLSSRSDMTVRAQVRREGGAPTRGEVGT